MMKNKQGLIGLYKMLGLQACLSLIMLSVSCCFSNHMATVSLGIGAIVFIIPYFFYGCFVFGAPGNPRDKLKRLYRGEVFKILITIGLFLCVWQLSPLLSPKWVFFSFGMLQLTVWTSPWIFK